MAKYEYDENLPYVVESVVQDEEGLIARFARRGDADHAVKQAFNARVIDTTPKPRVPGDVRFITYIDSKADRHYAERVGGEWWLDWRGNRGLLEGLPGVTPETVFTVLDVRADQ